MKNHRATVLSLIAAAALIGCAAGIVPFTTPLVQEEDEVITVGLGFTSGAASTETQEALVTALENDEVNVVGDVLVGTVVCASLDYSEDADSLTFALSSNETITATRTSFTVLSGSTFADGVARNVWVGESTSPSGRTVTLTWGEVCDVETFLLTVTSENGDGTISLYKSIPCEEGTDLDICVVELELTLKDEETEDSSFASSSATSTTTSGTISSSSSTSSTSRGRRLRGLSGQLMPSTGRRMQGSTQVDVMYLFSENALDVLGGISAGQMESTLATAHSSANEALLNSEIDLELYAVYVGPLPYLETSTTSQTVLDALEVDVDVAELRNCYGADLVQLWSDISSGIGNAYDGSSSAAFSVVDPNFMSFHTQTHEFGSNFGCYPNRESSGTITEYSHGYRYCAGEAETPYRTIMSYTCDGFTPDRVNYFSNPDVVHLSEPTGTATDDCARTIADNMVTVSDFRETVAAPVTCGSTPAPTSAPTSAPTPAPTSGPVYTGATRSGYCSGDPHCKTFDGVRYDCQGQGDFVLINVDATDTEIHGRFLSSSNSAVSWTTGIAAREGTSPTVQVLLESNVRSILIDGVEFTETAATLDLEGMTLVVTSNTVTWQFKTSGIEVVYTSYSFSGNVQIQVPLVFNGATLTTSGLLGNNNGIATDDWETSAGDTLTLPSFWPTVAEGTEFCRTYWAADPPLFTTTVTLLPAEGEDYVSPELPAVVPENVTELCGEDTSCIFDTILVGADFGATTLEFIEAFETKIAETGGTCPANTFSDDGTPPCSDCPEGETSGVGAIVCTSVLTMPPTPSPSYVSTVDPIGVTPAPTSSPSASSTVSYIGCYRDTRNQRIMELGAEDADNMTNELCQATCDGFAFFATQYGRECWCGDVSTNYLVHGESSRCTFSCPGDDEQTCGGVWAASVYSFGDVITPTPEPTAELSEFAYLGCYTDPASNRIMDRALTDLSMTTELCNTTCAGSTYFGTQYGKECWCGDADTDYDANGESTRCTYSCAGATDETCGGFYTMSVYEYA